MDTPASTTPSLPDPLYNPVRIRRLLSKLETAWGNAPALRLTQLVHYVAWLAAGDHSDLDQFYVTDADFEAALDRRLHEKGLDSGWKS